jgi:hypothetical protein
MWHFIFCRRRWAANRDNMQFLHLRESSDQTDDASEPTKNSSDGVLTTELADPLLDLCIFLRGRVVDGLALRSTQIGELVGVAFAADRVLRTALSSIVLALSRALLTPGATFVLVHLDEPEVVGYHYHRRERCNAEIEYSSGKIAVDFEAIGPKS